jgi:hypothetical protein
MNVRPVEPPPPGEPHKPSKKPNSKSFEEEMSRVDKIREVDPDEPKNRRTFQEEQEKIEKKTRLSSNDLPSNDLPSNALPQQTRLSENFEKEEPSRVEKKTTVTPRSTSQQPQQQPQQQSLPQGNFEEEEDSLHSEPYGEDFEDDFDYEKALPAYEKETAERPVEKFESSSVKTPKPVDLTKKPSSKIPSSMQEQIKRKIGKEKYRAQAFQQGKKASSKIPPSMQGQIKGKTGKPQPPHFPEHEKKLSSKEKFSSTKRKKGKDLFEEEKSSSKAERFVPSTENISPDIPKDILIEAAGKAAEVSSYLTTEIFPLFEKMVGTVMVMDTKNLVSTEVLLNSPSFADSAFFGTKIVIDRYSTAPNAFNIRLIGSIPAVDLFNDNLDSLVEAFQKGDYDFHIGRLSAEYDSEKPLIKRKSFTKEKQDEDE